jgi:hypothetical protein
VVKEKREKEIKNQELKENKKKNEFIESYS